MKQKKLDLLNLSDMLKEIDLEKNSKEDIRNVLDFIASKIVDYVESE